MQLTAAMARSVSNAHRSRATARSEVKLMEGAYPCVQKDLAHFMEPTVFSSFPNICLFITPSITLPFGEIIFFREVKIEAIRDLLKSLLHVLKLR